MCVCTCVRRVDGGGKVGGIDSGAVAVAKVATAEATATVARVAGGDGGGEAEGVAAATMAERVQPWRQVRLRMAVCVA